MRERLHRAGGSGSATILPFPRRPRVPPPRRRRASAWLLYALVGLLAGATCVLGDRASPRRDAGTLLAGD